MNQSITLAEFNSAYNKVQPFLNNTELTLYKDNIYIKKESQQKTGSLKWSGVLYSVIKVFENLLIHKTKPYYLVTQSTGNHGVAVIASIKTMIEHYLKIYPEHKDIWINVIPYIFTNKLIKDEKLQKMNDYLHDFPYNDNGIIDTSSSNYRQALLARTKFLNRNKGTYLDHGGKISMTGYGAIAFSIHNQLEKGKSVALYTAVGAGGPIGVGLCLSLLRETKLIISQTSECNAFIRTLESGKIQYNRRTTLSKISSGIAVDRPEKYAVQEGRKIIDKGITIEVDEVEKLISETGLSGSSCMGLAAVSQYDPKTDYIVVLDYEKIS